MYDSSSLNLELINYEGGCNIVGPMEVNSLDITNNKLPTIFVDGGLRHCALFKTKLFSVGDGDSLKTAQGYEESTLDIVLSTNKDESDLNFALNLIISKVSCAHLYGFYSGRDDHQLAVYGDIFNRLNLYKARKIYLYRTRAQRITFSSYLEDQLFIEHGFSLFTLSPQKICLKGAKYPKNDEESTISLAPLSSYGLSNIGLGKLFIRAQSPYMIVPY